MFAEIDRVPLLSILNKITIIFVCFLTVNFMSSPVLADLKCDSLAPQKPVESDLRAKIEGETGGALLDALGSVEFEGKFEKVERDILSSYPNADKLHMFNSMIYMLCGMIDGSALDEESKFEKFDSLTNKWFNIGSSFIVGQLNSDDVLQKRSAIAIGLKHPDSFIREITIESALQSEQSALRSLALQHILSSQSSFGGFVCDKSENNEFRNCIHSFGFNISEINRDNGSMNLRGSFTGSIFGSTSSSTREAAGSLSGIKLNVNSRDCSLNVSLEERGQLRGAFDCGRFSLNGNWVRGSHPTIVQLY